MALKFGDELDTDGWLESELNGTAPVSPDPPLPGSPGFSDLTPDPEPDFGPRPTGAAGDKVTAGLFDAPKRGVTKAIRSDVKGKVAFLLMMGGTTLAARDAHCGNALLASIPDQELPDGTTSGLAAAITDLVVDSPDLVRWFTSSGKFSKWLTLATVVQPIAVTAFQHHVTHAIGGEDPGQQPDWSAYGAG